MNARFDHEAGPAVPNKSLLLQSTSYVSEYHRNQLSQFNKAAQQSQLNSARFVQPNSIELKAEAFFKNAANQGFKLAGMFSHEVLRPDNLIASYMKQLTRA